MTYTISHCFKQKRRIFWFEFRVNQNLIGPKQTETFDFNPDYKTLC